MRGSVLTRPLAEILSRSHRITNHGRTPLRVRNAGITRTAGAECQAPQSLSHSEHPAADIQHLVQCAHAHHGDSHGRQNGRPTDPERWR